MQKKSFTSYVEEEVARNRRYLADEGGDGGSGGEPEGDGAPAESTQVESSGESFQLPDKFKSVGDLVKSYQALEKELGNRNNSPDYAERLEKQITELREAIVKKNAPESESDDDKTQQTKEYLRAMGVPFMEDLEKVKEQARKEYEFDRTIENLSQKYTGKDGRPAFNAKEIGEYALQNGLSSLPPETVFKIKYEKELTDFAINQALKGNKAPVVPGGSKKSAPSGDLDTSKMSSKELEALAREKALERIKSLDSAI